MHSGLFRPNFSPVWVFQIFWKLQIFAIIYYSIGAKQATANNSNKIFLDLEVLYLSVVIE